jgi:hypothetical protein
MQSQTFRLSLWITLAQLVKCRKPRGTIVKLVRALNARGVATARGGQWTSVTTAAKRSPMSISRMIRGDDLQPSCSPKDEARVYSYAIIPMKQASLYSSTVHGGGKRRAGIDPRTRPLYSFRKDQSPALVESASSRYRAPASGAQPFAFAYGGVSLRVRERGKELGKTQPPSPSSARPVQRLETAFRTQQDDGGLPYGHRWSFRL